jgi:hypothetical protein
MNVHFWLSLVLAIELVAIVCVGYLAFGGFFGPMRMLSKVGVWLMTLGLMVQIARTLYFFENGSYPVDTYFPWWITKDLGASVIVFDLVLLSRKMRLAAKNQKELENGN